MRKSTWKTIFIGLVISILSGCKGSAPTSASTSPAEIENNTLPAGTPLVTIGLWKTDDCSGDMIGTISFPVDYADQQCYSWPGHSGENSATNFVCGDNSFSYTQWTSLTCSGGQRLDGTRKTVYTDKCQQDVPPTLYSKIIDFSGCSTK